MKPLFWAGILASLLINSQTAVSRAYGQEEQVEREYKHDFEGQDLTGKEFNGKNFDDANFTDANLTNVRFENCSLKDCNFRGTVTKGLAFYTCDLTGSDFRESQFGSMFSSSILNKVNFSGLDLNSTSFPETKLREAILCGTSGFSQIYGADFYKADLRGTDFSSVINYNRANFRKAKYDQKTRWPQGFEIEGLGLIYEESKLEDEGEPKEDGEPKDRPEPKDDSEPKDDEEVRPRKKAKPMNDEAAFQKLDKNEDGVLSGSEMKGHKDKDADGDGEVSLAEFLGEDD